LLYIEGQHVAACLVYDAHVGIRQLPYSLHDFAYQFDNGKVNPRPQIPPIVCLLLITISEHSYRSLASDIVSLLAFSSDLNAPTPLFRLRMRVSSFATRWFVDNTLVDAATISLPAAFSKDEV
jgi:hypothetical protein